MKKFWAGFTTGIVTSIISAYLFTVLAIPPLVNINQYKNDIETTVQKLTKINFTIDRLDFDIDWALNLKLAAEGIKVSNIKLIDNISVETPAIDVMLGKQNLQMEFISELEKQIKKNATPQKAVKKVINEKLKEYNLNFKF